MIGQTVTRNATIDVDPQDGGVEGEKFRGARHNEEVLGSQLSEDARAQLLVSASQEKTLSTNDAQHQFCLVEACHHGEDLVLAQIGSKQLSVCDGVDAQRCGDNAQVSKNLPRGRAGAKEVQDALLEFVGHRFTQRLELGP